MSSNLEVVRAINDLVMKTLAEKDAELVELRDRFDRLASEFKNLRDTQVLTPDQETELLDWMEQAQFSEPFHCRACGSPDGEHREGCVVPITINLLKERVHAR